MALRMAMGTSRALPMPNPAWPCWSPTTTRAEKLRFLPPFTTLVTRLMATTWSFKLFALTSTGRRTARVSLRICLDIRVRISTPLPGPLPPMPERGRDTCTLPGRIPPTRCRYCARARQSPCRRFWRLRRCRRPSVACESLCRASWPRQACGPFGRQSPAHRCGVANEKRTAAAARASRQLSCARADEPAGGARCAIACEPLRWPLFLPLRSGLGCASFSGLLLQTLADQANALLLVRIRRAQGADLGRHLADLSLVGAGNGQARLLLHSDQDAFRYGEVNGP